MNDQYFEINRKLWNAKTPVHYASDFYDMESFLQGETSLKPIELDLLGDVTDRSVLHLQCHFGQDSLSLARMGARVCGIDISDAAIDVARKLNDQLNLDAEFVCCNLYDAPDRIDRSFDIVFCTYGTVGWLPDMERWARVVSHFLKPGGQLIFVELHPVLWMYDARFKSVVHSYFNTGPIVETTPGTYADKEADIVMQEVGWNHSLSEVISSLLATGLLLEHFSEYDYSPHNCFWGMEEREIGQFILPHLKGKLPMTYALSMRKPSE